VNWREVANVGGLVVTAVAAEAVATSVAGFLWLCEVPLNGKLGDVLFGKPELHVDYAPTAAPMCPSCGPCCTCA
jgi:hypothetical protein